MTPPPPDEAGRLLAAALDHAPEDRDAFLDVACGDNAVLRAELRLLLAAHEAMPPHFLADPAMPGMESSRLEATIQSVAGPRSRTQEIPSAEEAGERIGRYRLLQEIGQGGFGTVWMAEQVEPVTRRVALKIIKLGMDTKEVIARFEAERQALAMMDHQNIAKVLDAGATDKGRPFFVMELVKGLPITEFCDQTQLGMRERLMLFADVCSAINHAHQKGVIHRDIKPSNVMITLYGDKPVVKVIDFGIAKATQGKLTDKTLFTRFEQFVGTPVYMSPEQAALSGLDIDTRSDIYALGILLYELLVGKPPFDSKSLLSAGYDEMRRIIREVEPVRPSSRLSTIVGNERTMLAKARQIEPAKLDRLVEPDLDWIVMKAIDKDRTRRYETANGLALDIRRFLNDEPVSATPPTVAYQFRKFARRNKAALHVAAAIATVLVAATLVSLWQAVRATKAEKRAVAAFDELRESAPAFAEQARALVAQEKFSDAIAKLDYAIKLRPDEAEYLVAKADLLQCQLKLAEAAAMYREALRVKPGLARVQASVNLCDELVAAKPNAAGKLTRESLAKLHLAMQQQQRPAAELMPVARLLGEEKKLLVDYWLALLKELPVSAERPLKNRLTMREDGRLALDLSDTKVLDLSPLITAPLATLNLSKNRDLTDISPLHGLKLIELNVGETSVADLAPLREMHTLEMLDVSGSKVTTLTALSALRLRSLSTKECPIRDLNPIRTMPLEVLDLEKTRVTDLSPLAGMPLKKIILTRTPVLDFGPLAQLPLETCILQYNRIVDLSIFRGRPLKELVLWGCVDARNYAVLSEIQTLELLILPMEFRELPDGDLASIGALRNLPNLRQLGATVMRQMGVEATGSKDIFWQDWDREQPLVTALRKSGFKYTLTKLATGSYRLVLEEQPVIDLSILKGAALSELRVSSEVLSDLAPLSGMALTHLSLSGSKIRDFTPLKGLPLRDLHIDNCNRKADVAPLAEIPTLERLTVPLEAQNVEALRKLTKLQLLAFNASRTGLPAASVDEFWRMYDLSLRLRAAGAKIGRMKALDDGTWDLDLGNSNLMDLTLLTGSPISTLRIDQTKVTDLSPLRGMALKKLEIGHLKITDLSPLQGMPLQYLQATDGIFTNLSVLRGMPLKSLLISKSKITDLSPLRGLPLRYLKLHGCDDLTDLSPLLDCRDLQMLTIPEKAKDVAALRALTKLERIGYQDDGPLNEPNRTAEEFWMEINEPWRAALRAAKVSYTAYPIDGGKWGIIIPQGEFSDCSAFKGADNIGYLHISGCKVRDLSPLRGVPLHYLHIGGNPVTDLSPLRGMPLRELWLTGSQATEYSPLRGMKLEILVLHGSQFSDVSLLEGMPLKTLALTRCKNVTDVAAVLEFSTLEHLTVPWGARNIGLLRKLPNLKRLGYEPGPKSWVTDTPVADFWRDYDANPWIARLTDAGISLAGVKQLPDGTWEAKFSDAAFSDLELFRGVPFSSLGVGNTAVSDLAPLRGMALKQLTINDTKVTDLTPLKGMELDDLNLGGTKVTDLSALRGMTLKSLSLSRCADLIDFSPIADCKELQVVGLPPNAESIEFLRTLPKLERISFTLDSKNGYRPDKTTAEFWKDYDARAWLRALEKSGVVVKSARYLPDGTWDLNLDGNTLLSDLMLLRGVPISALSLNTTAVADLTPLRGSPLTMLNLSNTQVADLGPLQGMPIAKLYLRNTLVTDLTTLREMPLTALYLANCKLLTDLSPIEGCKELMILTLPPKAKDIERLRTLPKVERISFKEALTNPSLPTQTAAEFWKENDAKKAAQAQP
jgi:serine/threonine protein kinase/Leucine-rich repeat (LRR) protein